MFSLSCPEFAGSESKYMRMMASEQGIGFAIQNVVIDTKMLKTLMMVTLRLGHHKSANDTAISE